MVSVRNICDALASEYPLRSAEGWDNPGLQIGHYSSEVSRVLAALELTPEVVSEATESGADLIVTHHPFIFKPISSLTDATPEGRMLLSLAAEKIALYAAHTNFDCAPGAIARKLACDLGLEETQALLRHAPFAVYKIVVFAPESHAASVAEAMHRAGAGCIGRYRDVSFRGAGMGHFTGDATSHPAIGAPGVAETVAETRIEMAVSERDLARTEAALRAAHPYEEPAYDVFKLENDVSGLSDAYGFGTVGRLPRPTKLGDLLQTVKRVWGIGSLRVSDVPLDKPAQKIAILNGSGAKYAKQCAERGCDVYITGDCGHHDFDSARRFGMALVDAGHYETEKYIPEMMKTMLEKRFAADGVEVRLARSMRNPMIVV